MAEGILIVDDHSGFRAHARRLLEREGLRVVGEAHNCASAVAEAEAVTPEVALVDVYLPDGDGFELATRLSRLADPPSVILTSSHDESEFGPDVRESGARGFVPKAELSRAAIDELLP